MNGILIENIYIGFYFHLRFNSKHYNIFVISSVTVLKGKTEHIDQPKRYLFSVYKEANTKYKWFAKTKEQIQELANHSAKNIKLF
jgi:hypothetical protein